MRRRFHHSSLLGTAFTVALVGVVGCGSGPDPQEPLCNTPALGFVQLLYPIPNSTAKSGTAIVVYGIAQPFPSSSTVSGTGPFPISLTDGSESVATSPTTLPSPLPSPIATLGWPRGQKSEIYTVSFPALDPGAAYSVVATEPAYSCTIAKVENATTTIGSFKTQ